jgi:hypothetical protein
MASTDPVTAAAGTGTPPVPHRPRYRRRGAAAGIPVGIVLFQALLLTLFLWPALNAGPHDLPVTVAGPAPATAPLARELARAKPGAFDITRTARVARVDDRLRDREAYAVFVVGRSGVALHIATAASPQIAQLFRQVAESAGAAQGHPVPVVDVVPTDRDDPNGVVLSVGVLPLALTSLMAGILLGLLAPGRWSRLAGAALYAVLAGLASVAIAQYALSALPGTYLVNAASVALLAFAVAATVSGLTGLLGTAGAGLGALVMFVCGVPLSGISSSPDLLPRGWGLAGQLLPPGAGGTLLRSVTYFDGAAATRPLLVLAGWSVLGLVLLAVGRRRRA